MKNLLKGKNNNELEKLRSEGKIDDIAWLFYEAKILLREISDCFISTLDEKMSVVFFREKKDKVFPIIEEIKNLAKRKYGITLVEDKLDATRKYGIITIMFTAIKKS